MEVNEKMKKGQGMSLNVIVIAALVVLVLIVLSIIFVRSSGSFSSDLHDCIARGGNCKLNCEPTEIERRNSVCPDDPVTKDPKVCCLPINTRVD